MLKNEYTLNVDIKRKFTAVVPTFVQNDTAVLIFKVLDNGRPFNLEGVTRVEVSHKRKDGTTVIGLAEYSVIDGSSIIKYVYLGNEMSKEGFVETAVTIFKGDERVSIRPFSVSIVADLRNTVGASEEYGLLQDLIVAINEEITLNKEAVADTEDAIANAYNAATETLEVANSVKYIEDYKTTTSYKKNNFVSFNGSTYMAKIDSKNIAPPSLPETSNASWVLAGRKGADGTGTVVRHKDEFIATQNQKVFNLSNTYDQFQNRINVTVGYVPQYSPDNFNETSSTSITFDEGVPQGVKVIVEYFSEAQPLASDIQTTVTSHTQLLNNHTSKLSQNKTELEAVTQQLAETVTEIETLGLETAKKTEVQILVENKAEKTYVDSELSNKVTKGDGTLSDFNETTRAAIQGIEPGEINAVLGLGNVRPENTNFFKLSRNLFDKSKAVNANISETTGTIGATGNASYDTSDFTEIEPNAVYTLTKATRIVYFDASKNFISGFLVSNLDNYTITTPADARYIRFGISKTASDINKFMFVKGDSLPATYEAFGASVLPREKVEPPVNLERGNLGNSFLLNSDIPPSTNLNNITKDGFHTGIANGNYLNLPTDFNAAIAFSLRVSSVYKGGNRWYIQELASFINPSRKYYRRLDVVSTGTTPWKVWEVDRVDLQNATNIDSVVNEARYLGIGANNYGNIPTYFAGKSFFLDVLVYGALSGAFKIQKITDFHNPEISYIRSIINGEAGIWKKVGGSESGSSFFTGKTAVFFGDSLIEFGDIPEIVGGKLGFTAVNVGFGGCRMGQHDRANSNGKHYDKMCMYNLAKYINSGDYSELIQAADSLFASNGDDNRAIVSRLVGIDFNSVDFIVISYGRNDFGGNVPIGTDAENDVEGGTFKGAMNYIIEKIQTAYPEINILFTTPVYGSRLLTADDGLNSDDFPNSSGVYLKEYAEAINIIAKRNHIAALDLHSTSGINRHTSSVLLSKDGLHPSAGGYKRLASKFAAGMISEFA